MMDAQTIKTFDGKHKDQQVRLAYHLDKKSEWYAKLITDGHIGLVDAVIYSSKTNAKVVALLRGVGLDKFLRSGVQPSGKVPARKSFKQLVDNEESDTGS